MVMLGEAIVKIRTDDSEVDKGLNSTKSKFGAVGQTLSTALGAGAAVGFGALIRGAGDSITAASNLNEVISKSNTIFKDSSGVINKWAAGGAKDFGLGKTAALDAAGGFGNMFTQLGIGTDVAADMSMGIVELASDFGSFHNADISEVINAQQAAFRGEYDSVQRFLPLINAATVEQEALAMTGKKSTKELTAQDKALAVNALMFKGAGEAAGDFDRTSGSLANQQRTLNETFKDMQAEVGAALLPVMVTLGGVLLNDIAPVLSTLAKGIAPSVVTAIDLMAKAFELIKVPIMWLADHKDVATVAILTLGGAIAGVLVPAIIAWTVAEFAKVVALIASAAAFILAYAPIIAIGLAIGLLIAGIVLLIKYLYNLAKEVPIVTQAFEVLKTAVTAAIAFLADNIMTRIQGIIQIFTSMYEIFKNIVGLFVNLIQGDWSGAWENLKNIANATIDLVVGVIRTQFGNIPEIMLGILLQAVAYVREHFGYLPGIVTDFFGQVLSAITSFGSQIVNAVISFLTFLVQQWIFFHVQLPLLAIQYFTEILTNIINLTGQILASIITWLTNIVTNVTSFFGQLPGIALNFFGQMVQAIRDQIGAAVGAADELARGVINKTVEILGELRQAGIDGINALIDGIKSMGKNLYDSVTNFISDNIPGAVKKLLEIGSPSKLMFGLGINIVEGIINGIKRVLPSLASAAAAVKGVIWDAVSGVGGTVKDAAGRALDAAGNVIKGIDGALTNLFGGGGGKGGGISGNVESWRTLVAKYFPAGQVDNALRIIQAESGGNSGVVSPLNFNGTRDVGLFQINDVHGLSIGARQDPETNVRFAAGLFARSGWQPWSTAPGLGLAASGANVSANSPWIVGERGWELFVPNKSGQILSHDDSVNAMGKSGMNVNLYNSTIYARDEADAQRGAGDMAWAIRLRVAGVQV